MATEAELWDAQRATAEIGLSFAIDFLGCKMGDSNDQDLDSNATGRLMKIIRAVSWVESKHGTAGPAGNHPKEDPFQSGNPDDSWWKELTGQSGNGSRFIRGPGLGNLWAKQVQAAAEQTAGFPQAASFSTLGDKTDGHNDQGFTPSHSYSWGIIYLVHKINTKAGDSTYQCGDLARQRLIDGAVAYNGGGVADYEQRIIDALAIIGDIPPPLKALKTRRARPRPAKHKKPPPSKAASSKRAQGSASKKRKARKIKTTRTAKRAKAVRRPGPKRGIRGTRR
jgi:hypothetical protein